MVAHRVAQEEGARLFCAVKVGACIGRGHGSGACDVIKPFVVQWPGRWRQVKAGKCAMAVNVAAVVEVHGGAGGELHGDAAA